MTRKKIITCACISSVYSSIKISVSVILHSKPAVHPWSITNPQPLTSSSPTPVKVAPWPQGLSPSSSQPSVDPSPTLCEAAERSPTTSPSEYQCWSFILESQSVIIGWRSISIVCTLYPFYYVTQTQQIRTKDSDSNLNSTVDNGHSYLAPHPGHGPGQVRNRVESYDVCLFKRSSRLTTTRTPDPIDSTWQKEFKRRYSKGQATKLGRTSFLRIWWSTRLPSNMMEKQLQSWLI